MGCIFGITKGRNDADLKYKDMSFQINVTMQDELNGGTVNRMIDGSNALVNDSNAAPGWESDIVGNDEQIQQNLNQWILDRANDQHDTILTLVSWQIVRF